MTRIEKFLEMLPFSAETTRREFLKRSVVMGAMIPVAGTLLAACGGGDDDEGGDDPEPTAAGEQPTRGGIPTNSSGQGNATPEASPEATEAGEDEGEPTEAAEATEPADSGDGEAVQGGTVIMMGHHEIASLSPDDDGPTVHWVMTTNIHNSMVELDSFFVLQPVLCESWEISDDGMEYTFKLREGILFHDGEAFNSEDVKYTFDFYGNPDNASLQASNFRTVASVDAPDETTVVISLSQVDAAFIAIAGQTMIVPEHHHSVVGETGYKSDPIGTGPFMVADYDPASFCELHAFDDHFRGRPNLDVLRENIVPEASVRTISLESGEADHSVWSLLTEDNIKLRDSGDFTTFATSSVAVNHFPLNNERPYFADKVVRQAMMHAIDRDQIVDELWQGLAVKATANLSPALAFYYEPDVKQYEYDPELAAQMLDEAGWVVGSDGVREKDGVKLSWTCLVITGDQARKPEAEVVQQWLLAINMDMKIEEAPSTSQAMTAGTGDMALYNWTYGGGSGEPDASNTLRSDALNNFSHYKSPEMDALLDQGLAESDPDARKEIYSQVQKLVAEDVPFLFIKFWDWYTFFNLRLKGLPEEPLTTQFYNEAYLWWVDDEA
ncbi:MAG TPA: ABC transporter substrate-binding protein [Thermomicrobiales bacterium]|nr:ABC transporter substrate-binding protein [Thermomicrobiales bacterium]